MSLGIGRGKEIEPQVVMEKTLMSAKCDRNSARLILLVISLPCEVLLPVGTNFTFVW